MSNDIYTAGLKRAERERTKNIASELANFKKNQEKLLSQVRSEQKFISKFYPKILGTDASMFTIILQPFFPIKSLATPRIIKDKIMIIRNANPAFILDFPLLNPEPIPEGIMTFEWGSRNGFIRNEQFYSTGLIRLSFDVLSIENQDKNIYLVHIASLTFKVMKAAANFYRLFGYQGAVKGFLALDNAEAIHIRDEIIQSLFPDNNKEGLLQYYKLDLDIDTTILNQDKIFQTYFIKLVQEIFWMFGYWDVPENIIKQYLKNQKWYVE